MFPLARALERAGHELRWACAPEVCPELRDKGFDARPAGIYDLDPSPLRHPPPEIAALPPRQRPDHLFSLVFGPRRAAHVGGVQPIRPADPIERDATADPLVYITFGTVFNHDLTLFATALEAARELDVRVVVTLGPGNDPAALGPQPTNVTVARFIPQAQLLPACAAVVSHAGSGTFLAALAAGVPQVLLPQAADQFLNAEAGASAGVAIAIGPDELSVAGVRAALERVVGDPAFRTAAERAQAEISAMPPPDAVVEELERRYSSSGGP